MIRCRLARLKGEQKMRISDVIRETGFNRNTLTLIQKETAQKLDLEALEKLCELYACEVHEILEYVPDTGRLSGKATEHLKAMGLSV